MNADERSSGTQDPRSPAPAGRLTISIGPAISALVLAAILLTAAATSLLWWRTAGSISRQLASTINEQIVAAVRKEVSAIVDEARAAHTAVRTLFLQNVHDTREADKREFDFLSNCNRRQRSPGSRSAGPTARSSQLTSSATIIWK
jgi:adenylate cyclase